MNRLLVGALAFALGAIPATAQSLEDLNIQIHGYATQGFLYTTNNNIFTTSSSHGSPAWSEAVVNVGAQPTPKLRVGVQARYFLLGNYGNTITLDWAAADYKVNDKFGIRFGKVKTPTGLFNEVQDIDPSYIWSLLPQGIYPITSRNSLLAHYGGVLYGTLDAKKLGKLEYRAWGGVRVLSEDDGYFLVQKESGSALPNGLTRINEGAAIHWKMPLPGLMIGASNDREMTSTSTLTQVIALPTTTINLTGTEKIDSLNKPNFFGRYEHNKFMVAGEHFRFPVIGAVQFGAPPASAFRVDQQAWFGMASYKVTEKLTAGAYDSQLVNRQSALGPGRYQKDWAISGRYDFNQYLYAKAEQHFVQGTALGYDTTLNPNGLQPNTKLTVLKMGVSF
jgi:hypothetical protein